MIISIITSSRLSKAQEPLGSWNILSGKVTFSDKWTAFGEGQIRSLQLYDNFHYYEVKFGASYAFAKNFSIATSAGHYDTYREGGDFVLPKLSSEFRLWEQITMSQYLERLKFEHRYRLEQRWPQIGYRGRFRYRFSMTIPLGNTKVEPGTWYINFSDEVFFTNRAPYFERNRLFIGFGNKITKVVTIQAGYLGQVDYRLLDEIGRRFFQLSFLLDFDLSEKAKERMPGHVD